MSIPVNDLEKTVNLGLTNAIKSSKVNFDQLSIDIDAVNFSSTIFKSQVNTLSNIF